jgi:hypothetical protein
MPPLLQREPQERTRVLGESSTRFRWSVAALLGVMLAIASQARAQQAVVPQGAAPAGATYVPGTFYPPYYGGGGGYYGGWGGWGFGGWGWGAGSTAAGSYLTGLGNAIRAQGQYNLDTSAAAINLAEAAKRDIENQKLWTQTYFEMRNINQAYRSAQRRPPAPPETWVRLAQNAAPDRPSPGELDPVTGKIHWPAGLLGGEFKAYRDRLDALFADRALAAGAIGADMHALIRDTLNQMLDELRSRIRNFETSQYVAARRFLISLRHEATLPLADYSSTASLLDAPAK